MRQPVSHWAMVSRSSGGKSDPQSTIHPTALDLGGGENMRAPNAEYDPAPPRMFVTGGLGGWNSISSTGEIKWGSEDETGLLYTYYKHAQRAEINATQAIFRHDVPNVDIVG